VNNNMKNILKGIAAIIIAVLMAFLMAQLSGCSMEDIDREKLRDLEYEEVEEEYIPEEIYQELITDKENFNRKAYICSDQLYIVVCYGAQPTEGYTIDVDQLYESSNAIIVETTLKGPSRQEKVAEVISYPYIVLKVECIDKTVVFN